MKVSAGASKFHNFLLPNDKCNLLNVNKGNVLLITDVFYFTREHRLEEDFEKVA